MMTPDTGLILFLLVYFLRAVFADKHSLLHLYTIQSTNYDCTAVTLLNDRQIDFYNSSSDESRTPKQNWVKNIPESDWKTSTDKLQNDTQLLNKLLDTQINEFRHNQSDGRRADHLNHIYWGLIVGVVVVALILYSVILCVLMIKKQDNKEPLPQQKGAEIAVNAEDAEDEIELNYPSANQPKGPVTLPPKGPAISPPKGPAISPPEGPAISPPKGPVTLPPKGSAISPPEDPAANKQPANG